MLKSLLFLVFSGLVAMASGFAFVSTPAFRLDTSLEASRHRDKVATRTKWLEARGYGEGAATAVAEETEEEEAATEESAEESTEEAAEETAEEPAAEAEAPAEKKE